MTPDTVETGTKRGPKTRLLTLGHLDRRTRAARLAREVAQALTAELGGRLSAGQQRAVERAAVLDIVAGDAEARRLRGEAVSLDDVVRARRLARLALRDLGLAQPEPVEPEPAAPAASDPNWLKTFCAGIEAAAHSEHAKVAAAKAALKAGDDGQG